MMSGESGYSQENSSDEVYAELKKSPGWKEDGKKNIWEVQSLKLNQQDMGIQ